MSSRRVARQCDRTGCSASGPSDPPPSTASINTGSVTGTSSTAASATSTSATAADTESSPTTAATPSATDTVAAASSSSDAGAIAGGVIGGTVFLVLVVVGVLLYLRARKKKRTPPSSEFMNSIRAGAAPVLRLDSGAEYTPALSEKGTAYTHYPPAVPLPFMQNTYYGSSSTQDMKYQEEMSPSARPSVDRPLRLSSRQQTNDSSGARHLTSSSVGSRRELWGSDAEVASGEFAPVRTSSALHFAPCYSMGDDPSSPSHLSHSPPPLHPLRRQPDPDDT